MRVWWWRGCRRVPLELGVAHMCAAAAATAAAAAAAAAALCVGEGAPACVSLDICVPLAPLEAHTRTRLVHWHARH